MNLLSALIDIWIGKAFLGCLAWLFRKWNIFNYVDIFSIPRKTPSNFFQHMMQKGKFPFTIVFISCWSSVDFFISSIIWLVIPAKSRPLAVNLIWNGYTSLIPGSSQTSP